MHRLGCSCRCCRRTTPPSGRAGFPITTPTRPITSGTLNRTSMRWCLRRTDSMRRARIQCRPQSQRTQEFEQGFLILLTEAVELLTLILRFTAVAQDGIAQAERGAIVHQPRSQSQAPQGSGAHFVLSALEMLV